MMAGSKSFILFNARIGINQFSVLIAGRLNFHQVCVLLCHTSEETVKIGGTGWLHSDNCSE